MEKLGASINSDRYHEASPILSLDGKTLYFTRTGAPDFVRTLINDGEDLALTSSEAVYQSRLSSIYSEIANTHIADPVNSGFNQDIWVAHSKEKQFDEVEHPSLRRDGAYGRVALYALENG